MCDLFGQNEGAEILRVAEMSIEEELTAFGASPPLKKTPTEFSCTLLVSFPFNVAVSSGGLLGPQLFPMQG